MALDLGIIAPGTLAYGPEGGGTTGSDPFLEVIASADDADYAYVTSNSTNDLIAVFALGDMPADFLGMSTLAVQLRYARASGTQVNSWTLRALIRETDAVGADFTNTVDVATGITTTTFTNSSVINFTLTAAGVAATKAQWDDAVLVIRWVITRVGGGDTLQKRVSAGQLTGTYGAAVSVTGHGDASTVGTGELAIELVTAGHGDVANQGPLTEANLEAVVAGHGDVATTGTPIDPYLELVAAGHGDLAIIGTGDNVLSVVTDGHGDVAVMGVGEPILSLEIAGHGDAALVGRSESVADLVVEGHGDNAITGGSITVDGGDTPIVLTPTNYQIGTRRLSQRSRSIRVGSY